MNVVEESKKFNPFVTEPCAQTGVFGAFNDGYDIKEGEIYHKAITENKTR